MQKKLIGPHNVADFICADEKTLRVDSGMILSPGAKDILRVKGISIVYGEKSPQTVDAAKKGNQETVKPDDKAMLVSKVINILRREYGVVEEDRIREISLMVMNKIS